jgi:phosphate transport system substrate-binding protein
VRNRALRWIVTLGVLIFVFAGSAHAQQTIRIDGSTGVAPLIAALAKAYQAKQPGVTIEIGKGLGTKARIEALAAGTIDVAMASHGLAVNELTKAGMVVREVARTPVVFGVNAGVSVATLTEEQVCAVYAGSRSNWKELGGSDLVIAPRTRPDSEVDTEVMRDGVTCLKSLKMVETVKVMQRGGDMAAELAAVAGAIGMTTTTVVEQSAGKIRALALNGVVADEANVRAGRYKLVREVFLVTAVGASPVVAGFLSFVEGPEGAAVIKTNGAIPTGAR